jgi:hypothetical protein
MTESKPPRLRIVRDPNDPAFELIPAPPRSKSDQSEPGNPQRRGQKPRMPKIDGKFAPVEPKRLQDRRYDIVYPPRTRLFLFIVARSKRGTAPFALTNVLAATLGLDRYHKSRLLGQLEQHGLVVITRRKGTTVWVSAEG